MDTFWLFLAVALLFSQHGIAKLCDVETGDAVIILDITESDGNETGQATRPPELPISGQTDEEILLQIVSDPSGTFALDGKKLTPSTPLDRDEEDRSSIQLQISCSIPSTTFKRVIPVMVRIADLNDNPPEFQNLPYKTTVSELAQVGSTVFRELSVTDADSSVNGLVEYAIRAGNDTRINGPAYFAISLPHQGFVTVKRQLDYERMATYELIIEAVDQAVKPSDRQTATATLTVYVEDADDQDPAFVYSGCTRAGGMCINPDYSAQVTSGVVAGNVEIEPEAIKAVDRDEMNNTVQYIFLGGSPASFHEYFTIDSNTGTISQIQAVNRSQIKKFSIIIKAEEVSALRRYSTARLLIDVLPADENLPMILANSQEGYVDEHSPFGTVVSVDSSVDGVNAVPKGLQFTVSDADLEPDDRHPRYIFELTTGAFVVNSEGYLAVNNPNLDRDPPNPDKYTFQVVAREVESGVASAPVLITVYLNDINDNSPEIVPLSPLRVDPGRGPRPIAQVQARDLDAGSNAQVVYTLYHATNGGQEKFRIDESTGRLDAVGPLLPGQQYSLTLQAADLGGRSKQEIVDVVVTPGMTSPSPLLPDNVFDIQVSEAAAVNTVLLSLRNDMAEKYGVTYTLVSGDPDSTFHLSPTNGVLTLRRQLDREKQHRYSLAIQAKGRNGATNSATIHVEVVDVNDSNPEFLGQPYIFHADEGVSNVIIGTVQARDADAGQNGLVYYSAPQDTGFTVDAVTGEVRTRTPLDFESQPIHHLIVTARDGAVDPRIATATVTVVVKDLPDEVPIFPRTSYEGNVPENSPNVDVVQVKAIDPDSQPQVTYIIRDGARDRFSINPETGVIHTIRALDYEVQRTYVLTIGTVENYQRRLGATCIVRVNVMDRNDVPPVFTSVPLPIRLRDDIRMGSAIATLTAVDSDGTPPNNLVKYSLGAAGRLHHYFDIDHDSGVVSIKGDLTKEPTSELRLEVRAYDLGTPQLTASATVMIYLEHTVTPRTDSGIGFADTAYTVEVEENCMGNKAIKTISIINKPGQNVATECEIEKGNELGHFLVESDNDGSCVIRTKGQQLDYETKSQYTLSTRLLSATAYVNPKRSLANVTVNVVDMNDNPPKFAYRTPASLLVGKMFVAAVSSDSPALTPVIRVTASDNDSGPFGELVYLLLPESDPGHYFYIDRETGVVYNSRTFENLFRGDPPFQLTILASDNPKNAHSQGSLNSTAPVVVNLIRDENRLVLVIRGSSPDKVKDKKDSIVQLIQEHSGCVIGIERIESRKFINSSNPVNTLTDSSGTDVWFYAISPETTRILDVEDPKLSKKLLSKVQQQELLFTMSSSLSLQAETIRFPFIPGYAPAVTGAKVRSSGILSGDLDGFQAALAALAGIIAVLGIVGTVYLCYSWSRYKSHRKRIPPPLMVPALPSQYEPIMLDPSPIKPYETQVLQMNVPLDDASSIDGVARSRRPIPSLRFHVHPPEAQEISYITKAVCEPYPPHLRHAYRHSPPGRNRCSPNGAGGESSYTESDSFDGMERTSSTRMLTSRGPSGGGGTPKYGVVMKRHRDLDRDRDISFYNRVGNMEPAQNPVYHSSDENNGSPTHYGHTVTFQEHARSEATTML